MNVLDWKNLLSRNKKRKPSDFIVIILIGVLFLILSIPTEKKETDEKTGQEKLAKETGEKKENQDEYLEESEKQLAEILESIEHQWYRDCYRKRIFRYIHKHWYRNYLRCYDWFLP